MSSTPPIGNNQVRSLNNTWDTDIPPNTSRVPYSFYTSLQDLSTRIHNTFVCTDNSIKIHNISLGGDSPFSLHFRGLIKRDIASTKILEQVCKRKTDIKDSEKVFSCLLKRHGEYMILVYGYAMSPIANSKDDWKRENSVSAIVFKVEDITKEIIALDSQEGIIRSFKGWWGHYMRTPEACFRLEAMCGRYKEDVESSNPAETDPLYTSVKSYIDSTNKLKEVYMKGKFPESVEVKVVANSLEYAGITSQLDEWFTGIKDKPQTDIQDVRELQ